MKYLIVAESPGFRKYLREFITDINNQCFELDDGLSVNSVYNDFKPDWVLIDILLENANSFKTAENLKRGFPKARIAIISAYSNKLFNMKSPSLSSPAFIPKEKLFELIETIQLKQIEKDE